MVETELHRKLAWLIGVPWQDATTVGSLMFSEGLRAELRKDKILVTTVCPGLMRTGSARNASFKGNNEAEYAWFSASASLPGLSIAATDAACAIVDACARGQAEVLVDLGRRCRVSGHRLAGRAGADVVGDAQQVGARQRQVDRR